jgi:hypothetical protein
MSKDREVRWPARADPGSCSGRRRRGPPRNAYSRLFSEPPSPGQAFRRDRRADARLRPRALKSVPGRYKQPVHAVGHDLACACMVGDYYGEAAGHRFDDGQSTRIVNRWEHKTSPAHELGDVVVDGRPVPACVFGNVLKHLQADERSNKVELDRSLPEPLRSMKEHANALSVRNLPDVEAPKRTGWATLSSASAGRKPARSRRTAGSDASLRNAPLRESVGDVSGGHQGRCLLTRARAQHGRGLRRNELMMIVRQAPNLP